MTEAYPRGPAQRHAERDQALGQPQGAACPGGGHRRQAFSEDAAGAVAIATKPLAHAQLEAYAIVRPGQIGHRAVVAAVETSSWGRAERTGHAGVRRPHPQSDLCRGSIDIPRVQGQRCGIR